jgi:AMMECR1 domain-containing protein
MLGIKLDELSKLLQECTILEELEETQVQLAQKELDEIRSLAKDEVQVHETPLEIDKTPLETNETLDWKVPSVEIGF